MEANKSRVSRLKADLPTGGSKTRFQRAFAITMSFKGMTTATCTAPHEKWRGQFVNYGIGVMNLLYMPFLWRLDWRHFIAFSLYVDYVHLSCNKRFSSERVKCVQLVESCRWTMMLFHLSLANLRQLPTVDFSE